MALISFCELVSIVKNTILLAFGNANGLIEIRSPNGYRKFYRPLTDTTSARTANLMLACAAAQVGDCITLRAGNITINTGAPMASVMGHASVSFHFGKETALLYTDPEDAASDANFFRGIRNVRNFGADNSGVNDSSNAFEAAEFSLPLYGGGASTEGYPGLGYNVLTNILLRYGTRLIPGGNYLLSRQLWMSAYQSLITDKSRVAIYFGENIANDPLNPKPAWGVRRSINGASAQSNFSHNVIVDGIIWAKLPTGNAGLYCGLIHGAQCSSFTNIGMGGFVGGCIFGQYTDFIHLGNWDINSIDGVTPSLHFVQCNNITCDNISITNHNPLGVELDAQGDMQAAIRMDSCFDMKMTNVLAESAPVMFNFYTSSNVSIECAAHLNLCAPGNVAASGAVLPIVGSVTADLHNCGNIEFNGLRHKFVESVITQENIIIKAGAGVVWNSPAVLVPTNYASDKILRIVDSTVHRMNDLGAYISYTREDANWKLDIISINNISNPAVSFTTSDMAGAGAVTHLNIADANGGVQAGYHVTATDLFSWGTIRSQGVIRCESGYYYGATQVVGPRDTGWIAMTGTATKSTIATYTAPVISGAYVQAEVQAIADSLQATMRRLKAIDDALHLTHGLTGA